MNATEERKKLRTLLAGSKCLLPASVFDAMSARIAETIGYEIGLLSGSVVASATLAAPDIMLHTATEYADLIRRITRASTLSLYVDGDNGFGNALNVMRTVREFEHSGVSGIAIEDSVKPDRFGRPDEQELVPIEEAVGKLRAAVAARNDPALVISARTPAIKLEGIESGIARARAYAATGVDVIHIASGKQTLEQLRAMHEASGLPLVVGPSNITHEREELAACGARIVLAGHDEVPIAVKALHDAYAHLFNGGNPADLKSKAASAELMEALMREEQYRKWTDLYME